MFIANGIRAIHYKNGVLPFSRFICHVWLIAKAALNAVPIPTNHTIRCCITIEHIHTYHITSRHKSKPKYAIFPSKCTVLLHLAFFISRSLPLLLFLSTTLSNRVYPLVSSTSIFLLKSLPISSFAIIYLSLIRRMVLLNSHAQQQQQQIVKQFLIKIVIAIM